jgi:protein TonB
LFLILGAAFSLYISSQHKSSVHSPAFLYDEVVVQKRAIVETRVSVRPIVQAKEVAVSKSTNPVSVTLPINPPMVISQVLPEYPASALENEIEGVAMVQAYVGLNGKVEKTEVKTSSGNENLDASAINAVSKWIFSPATQGSASISSWFEVPVRFSIK